MLLALRIERVLTKARILELYLNEIYLGQGAYGVVAAAQAYFNKPLDQLTTGEAAMLAALPKSPLQLQSVPLSRTRPANAATGCWTAWWKPTPSRPRRRPPPRRSR